MVDIEYLPTVHEEDVESGRGYELHMERSSPQNAAMAASGSETGGENKLHTKKSSTQKVVVLIDDLEDTVMTDRAPIERQSQGQPPEDTDKVQVVARNTRSASKRQGEAIETGNKIKANSLEEEFEKLKVCLQSCQSELKGTKEMLAVSKKDSKDKQAQLCKNKKDLATCRRELKEFKADLRNMKEANNDLEETLEASQEELSKCKDDLFSLQGVAQTPDSVISKEFETISQQIVQWIDMTVATFEKTYPNAEPDHVFSVGWHQYSRDFLQHYPGASEHVARYLIHHFLQIELFGEMVCFFGLPEETARLLQEAELKMAKLDPPRDSVAIASWRSETLKAIAETKICADYCRQQSLDLHNNLFKRLFFAFPALFWGPQAHATFCHQVLVPAVKLAKTIKMST